MNENICPLLWMSLEVDSMGQYKPCCISKQPVKEQDQTLTVKNSSITQAFNSEYMKNLRQEFINGEKPKACDPCWNVESAGITSKRQYGLMKYHDILSDIDFESTTANKIGFFDLKLGNICNIKCRICGPESSSTWMEETFKMFRDRSGHKIILDQGRWPRTTESFWAELNSQLENIRYLEITGGEPFLIEQQFDLLRTAVAQGHAHNIDVHYNTNGTVYPESAISEIWPHFKNVEIAFSIDDLGDRFHYQRYPAKWEEVKQNLQKVNFLRLKNPWLRVIICCTINKQNIYYLPEIYKFIKEQKLNSFHFNMLHTERIFNISYLNPDAKQKIKDRIVDQLSDDPDFERIIQPIINFMMVDNQCNDGEFLQRLRLHDQHRGQNFSEIFPEFYQLIQNYDQT